MHMSSRLGKGMVAPKKVAGAMKECQGQRLGQRQGHLSLTLISTRSTFDRKLPLPAIFFERYQEGEKKEEEGRKPGDFGQSLDVSVHRQHIAPCPSVGVLIYILSPSQVSFSCLAATACHSLTV